MFETPLEIRQEDIAYILEHPWGISAKEWGLRDRQMRDSQLAYLKEHLALAKIDGYAKLWKTSTDEPIALLGGYKVADKKYETFFIASKHMQEHAMRLSFEMRKILKEKATQYKGCSCGLYSTSEHPSQISWFRFLGFKYLPEHNLGSTRYFEFVAPKHSQ
jgi:hypothetical protein